MKVSVIIPTYNRQNSLLRAVDSVLGQTHFAGEIVIVDDGSTDNTAEIIAPYLKSSPIRYHKTANFGPAKARNVGVLLSQHDYIAFLDSDDHWFRDKLRLQVAAMEENTSFVVSHTGEKWLRNGQHLNKKNIHYPQHGDIFQHCLKLCAVGMSTALLRKEVYWEVGGLDESLPCCEDYDLWLRLSAKYPFFLLPEPLTVKEGGGRTSSRKSIESVWTGTGYMPLQSC